MTGGAGAVAAYYSSHAQAYEEQWAHVLLSASQDLLAGSRSPRRVLCSISGPVSAPCSLFCEPRLPLR